MTFYTMRRNKLQISIDGKETTFWRNANILSNSRAAILRAIYDKHYDARITVNNGIIRCTYTHSGQYIEYKICRYK